MTIRNRLALRFMLLASLIMGVAMLVVYSLSARYRIEEFQERIHDRGRNVAMLLLQVDEVDQQLLNRIERDSPAQVPGEAVRIFDRHGAEIFSRGVWRRPEAGPELLEKVLASDGMLEMDDSGETIGFIFNDRGERYIVLVAGEDRFGKSKLRNLGRVVLVTYGFGVLITFLVGRVYAQRALDPLKRLVGEVRSMQVGDLHQRVEVGEEEDEIAQLATSFNELLGRLATAFNSQRNFIANASHELRTPLTVISGQLEVLLLMERSGDEYRHAVASVLEDMRSLNRLADRLLMLAQADDRISSTTFTPVRMDEIIWQARTELVKKKKDHVVDVVMPEVDDERSLQVQGNEDLLRSLVFNLMENGCKYSPDHRVEVRMSIDDGQIQLDLADQGIGIPEPEWNKIFSPFFRGSNTSGSQGHGIGLSLVQRIAELHNGRIGFQPNVPRGTVFIVSLPHL